MTKIHYGDCLDVMKTMSDQSIDMVFTSPPYANRRKNSYEGVNSTDYNEWFTPIAKEIKRIMKPNGSFFLNIKSHCDKGERDLYTMKLVIMLREQLGFRFTDEFCWTKNGVPGRFKGRFKNAFEPVYHFTLNSDYTFNPESVSTPTKPESLKRYERKVTGDSKNGSGFSMRNRKTKQMSLPSNHLHLVQKSNQNTLSSKHPAVFPVELPDFFIRAFSNEGDTILDPFMGSGTTGVASLRNGRNFMGIDNNHKYYCLTRERLDDERNSMET